MSDYSDACVNRAITALPYGVSCCARITHVHSAILHALYTLAAFFLLITISITLLNTPEVPLSISSPRSCSAAHPTVLLTKRPPHPTYALRYCTLAARACPRVFGSRRAWPHTLHSAPRCHRHRNVGLYTACAAAQKQILSRHRQVDGGPHGSECCEKGGNQWKATN